jgi:hypothetical protein
LSLGAGVALAAIKVRFHAAAVARLEVVNAFADGQDLHAQFVAGDARIVEEGELSEVATNVGSANPHAGGPDESFARTGLGRFVYIDPLEFLGGRQLQGLHVRGIWLRREDSR